MTSQSSQKSLGEKTRTLHADIHDPKEVRIRNLIRKDVEATDFGKEVLTKLKEVQEKYFANSLSNIENADEIYTETQKILREISGISNSRIVEGEDLIKDLVKGEPYFLALNHFGLNKLTTFSPERVGLNKNEVVGADNKSIEEIYPFPIYYAAAFPIAELLGDDLAEAHLELPGDKLAKLQESAGLIVVPSTKGKFQEIKDRSKRVIENHPNSLVVIFPEGETSGKRNERGPYDLLPFHSGLWGIATELSKEGIEVPVITAYQYWNPKSGFEVGIVGVDKLSSSTNRDDQEKMAHTSQSKMQDALNKRLQGSN